MSRLHDYSMPPCMTAIPEVNACYKIAAEMQQIFEDDLERLEKELHTDTASALGISHREKMLNITPAPTDTIEERRFRVQIAETVIDILNEKNLKALVKKIGGEESFISIDRKEKKVTVRCSLTSAKMFSVMKKTVEDYIPVTFAADFSLLYNSYNAYRNETFENLSTKTWDEIRNEVDGNGN
ncbi:MAG: YmfQ family protein [Faecalibacterium sp.]|nr:YmfQ family protein [Ruminococcus sp.]MCM1392116.1 YmfQ family protein [Ruminococcus sp.]MCM1485813.1 YmfQ family protein [Faecalibacterium sp.]